MEYRRKGFLQKQGQVLQRGQRCFERGRTGRRAARKRWRPDPFPAALPEKERFPEEGLFDWVQGQSGAFPRKPDPAGALYIAEQFGVKPEECLVFEDIPAGILAGKAAGMPVIAVEDDFSKDLMDEKRALADAVIADYRELL